MTRFTRAEIKVRIAAIESIYIETGETIRARDELEDALDFGGESDTAALTLLLAPTGFGKSALAKSFMADHDPSISLRGERMSEGSNLPGEPSVLYVSLPTPCTVKGMTEELLDTLDDPLSHRNSTAARNTRRIAALIAKKNIKLCLIDEFQHLIDPDRDRVLKSAAEWLKRTLDQIRIPVVCVGLPDSVLILKDNKQLSRRTGKLIRMSPFAGDKAAFNKFRAFLGVYEQQLGFGEPSGLSDESVANAIFKISGGLIGPIKQLVLEAAKVSMQRETGPDAITMADLAKAFDALPIEGANPFDAGYGVKTLWGKKERRKKE